MRKAVDFFSWGFLLLFFIPTTLIVASWNALPGDTLYGTKLGFENALLALTSPSAAVSGALSIKYTERRFSESKQLLADKHSVEGLPYFDRQVVETKTLIDQTTNKATKQELVRTYLATLQNVSTQLEQQKQIAAAQNPSGSFVPSPTQFVQSFPTPIPQTASSEQTPVPAQPAAAPSTVAQITQTQQTVNQTINELQTMATPSEDHGNSQDKSNNGNNQGHGQGKGNGGGND